MSRLSSKVFDRGLAPLLLICCCVVALAAPPALAEDAPANWPSWRGPDGSGANPDAEPPLTWSESENVRWKIPLPGLGSSTPVVWGDTVFVTTAVPVEDGSPAMGGRGGPPASDFRFVVMALDLADGKVKWQHTARTARPHEGTHPDGTYASPSPVTDGEHVFAFFGSHGLYAYDFEGEPVWSKDFGDMKTRLSFGEGSSPAIHGRYLAVLWDHEGDDFIAVLDKSTGEEIWRRERDEPTNWSTPLVVEHGGKAHLIVNATNHVRSYDLASGETLWEVTGMTQNVIPSPVYDDGVVYLMSGFRGNALMAVKLDGASGDVTGKAPVLWTMDRDTPYVPSPLLHQGLLYFLKSNKGLLTVVDVTDGKVLYGPERLDTVRNIYASPIAAAGRVYLVGRDGGAVVLKAGRELEVLAENHLDAQFDASPVAVGDTLLLRGREHLYALAEDAE